jgi:hypothetical protein
MLLPPLRLVSDNRKSVERRRCRIMTNLSFAVLTRCQNLFDLFLYPRSSHTLFASLPPRTAAANEEEQGKRGGGEVHQLKNRKERIRNCSSQSVS